MCHISPVTVRIKLDDLHWLELLHLRLPCNLIFTFIGIIDKMKADGILGDEPPTITIGSWENDRAIAYNKLGRYPEAIHDASFALGLVPGNAAALQTRSWALAQAGKFQAALADANYSLEKDPANAYAYYNRAFALLYMGKRDEAITDFSRVIALKPDSAPAYLARGSAFSPRAIACPPLACCATRCQ